MSASEEFEQFVVPCYVSLVSALRPSLLLDHLRQARLINGPEYRDLQAASSEEDRSRRLLSDILPRKEKGTYRKFCEVLLANRDQAYIVATILEQKGPKTKTPKENELPSGLQLSPATQRSNTNQCLSLSAEVQESPSKKLAIFCAGEVGSGSRKVATFFFSHECYCRIQANEFAGDMIKNLCEQCLGVEQEKVVFAHGDIKSLLKAKGYAMNCNIDTLLAVLIVNGIEQTQVEKNRHNLESAVAVIVKDLEPTQDVSAAAVTGTNEVEADGNKASNQSGETKDSFFYQEAMPDGTEQPFTSLFCDKIAEGGLVQFESSTHPLHSMKPNSGGSVLPQHGMLGKHSSTMEVPSALKGYTAEVTEAQLNIVAKIAKANWQEIGLHLGFESADMDEYEAREPRSLHYRLFHLLVDWKRRVDNPTVGDVILACQKAGTGGEVKRALQDAEFK